MLPKRTLVFPVDSIDIPKTVLVYEKSQVPKIAPFTVRLGLHRSDLCVFRRLDSLPVPLVTSVTRLMDRVVDCCEDIPLLLEALFETDTDAGPRMANQMSAKACLCDTPNTQLRDAMPSGLFMPVGRRDLLQPIAQIDAIADCAEDVGVLLTLRTYVVPGPMNDGLRDLIGEGMATVRITAEMVSNVDVLLASGFSGPIAAEILDLIKRLGAQEHRADKRQDRGSKLLFQQEGVMSPEGIFMWNKVLNRIGDLANHAENVGGRVRLFLAR